MTYHPSTNRAILYSNVSDYKSYQHKTECGALIRAFCTIVTNEAHCRVGQRHLHELILDIQKQTKINTGMTNGGKFTIW